MKPLEFLPAVDIKSGQVTQVVDNAKNQYQGSPQQVIESFIAAGCKWIHLVDLDPACYGWCKMRESIAGSLIIILLAGFLIFRLSKRGAMTKYEKKPQSKWNSLSEGVDPTDE
jgi:hypothetical protein